MNTFTNIYLHVIFSVKYRAAMIEPFGRDSLHAYIASIINAHDHQTLIVGGTSDHVHILLDYNPKRSVSELVKEVKMCSTQWVNNQPYTGCKFAWQWGYGVFSYAANQVDVVKKYISNQEAHHARVSHVDEFA
jgi:REP element-mobilizing transposase RayT